MNKRKLKVVVFLSWILCVAFFCILKFTSDVNSQASKPQTEKKPSDELINKFDQAIHRRFLEQPNFGIRRIGPQPNPHLETFVPASEDEKNSVTGFQEEGWAVGLYLFGRRANEIPVKKNGKTVKKLHVVNKLNAPLPITEKLKSDDLAKSESLLEQVKIAFQVFQTSDNYEFEFNNRAYVAKPVRAMNESCLQCHTDFYITKQVAKKTYKYRPRKVGDTIGVLVYSFEKAK